MESNEKSPIIERLCRFIDFSGLTTSQFADKAGIPRPSMSQMLHGRNKSLNNHVLSKLNDAFPELNIVWLLFGRGEMCENSNFKISEPQNPGLDEQFDEINPEDQLFSNLSYDTKSSTDFIKNSAKQAQVSAQATSGINFSYETPVESKISSPTSAKDNTTLEERDELLAKVLASNQEKSTAKKIASIIVLYTDNSFDTFMPSSEK